VVADKENQAMMEKIRKLLALADSTKTTEAEATAAALKIQELVQTYGLDLAQIEAQNQDSQHGVRDMGTVNRRAMFDWQQLLMETIATNNFCLCDVRVIYVEKKNRNSKQHFLVGRKLNIDITIQMYDYLIETMKRLCEQGGFIQHKTRTLFYEGCAKRLTDRLKQQRRQRELEEKRRKDEARNRGEQVNALVLTDVYGSEADMNNDILNGYAIGTTARERSQKVDREAKRHVLEEGFVKLGHEPILAFYLSHGLDMKTAKDYAKSYRAEVQKRARRAQRQNHRGFTMHERKEHGRTRTEAYRAGLEAGSSIGLDPQVDEVLKKRLG
jgi:hypothetical protein